jgi:hypothetical protein
VLVSQCLEKNEGHCLTYGQRRGGGQVWAGALLQYVLYQCARNRKATEKDTEKDTKKLQTFDFQGFCGFLFGCFGDRKMYRIAGGLACKNRAN